MSLGLHLDAERCSGCGACAVACMDQNDLVVRRPADAWRRIHRVESSGGEGERIGWVSLSCMHCEDAPCLPACPSGALRRTAQGPVEVDVSLCIGCHSCALACPFGAPRFGADGSMRKCDLCADRLRSGLEPACARVCPTGALRFGEHNELAADVGSRAAKRLFAL